MPDDYPLSVLDHRISTLRDKLHALSHELATQSATHCRRTRAEACISTVFAGPAAGRHRCRALRALGMRLEVLGEMVDEGAGRRLDAANGWEDGVGF